MTMVERLRCLVGLHDWRRSQFVALNQRAANFVCRRCDKQKQAPENAP
jgi:hypothetical protein